MAQQTEMEQYENASSYEKDNYTNKKAKESLKVAEDEDAIKFQFHFHHNLIFLEDYFWA